MAYERKRSFRHKKILLREFSERASVLDMNITCQEIFRSCIVGLDTVKRNLLIINWTTPPVVETFIDLSEIKHCNVRHDFDKNIFKNQIRQGPGIIRCSFVFEYKNGKILEVPLENGKENYTQLKQTVEKTSKWIFLLSQLLNDSPLSIPKTKSLKQPE